MIKKTDQNEWTFDLMMWTFDLMMWKTDLMMWKTAKKNLLNQ